MDINEEMAIGIQLVVGGSQGCGQTTFVKRIMFDRFDQKNPDEGRVQIKYNRYKRVLDSQNQVNVHLWQFPFEHQAKDLIKDFSHDAWGVIHCFDLTELSSFEKLQRDFKNKYVDLPHHFDILVGLQSDLYLERKVDYKLVKSFADNIGIEYKQISSKNDSLQKLQTLFKTIIQQCMFQVSITDLLKDNTIKTQNDAEFMRQLAPFLS